MNEFDNGLKDKWDFDFDVPSESEVDVLKLDSFLKDGDGLIFYGGEPLVNFSKMKEIIDFFEKSKKEIKFFMQTNGKLLKIVPFDYLNKISKILVSLDGDKERTDFNRGRGTYEIVMNNLKHIREKGFSGEIVARMVVSGFKPDIFEQVKHLLDTEIFDSIHWQLDAGFYKSDFEYEKFLEFSEKYNSSVDKLIDFWIKEMEKGKVLKIYPFVGILNRLMGWDDETRIHCGSGYANYTITTDGKIVSCPIMNNVKNFYAGNLNSKELREFEVGEPCTSCDYKDLCGGRCLYSNQAKLWPPEGEKLICGTIIHLIEKLKEKIPKIEKLIHEKIISVKDFEYEKYFGPEIIP
jgi:putative peptide-modifying radical SAM enzyme